MGKFGALLGLNIKAMLLAFRMGGGKKRAYSGGLTLLLMGALSLYLSGTYSYFFALELKNVSMLPLLLMLMPVLALLAGFFFTVFAAQGVIFGGRDNDLLFALPVSAFTLLLSRLTALYLENLVFTGFVMLPAGAIYLLFGGGAGPLFFPAILLGTALLALIPTLLALLGGFLLSWVTARFARRRMVTLLLYGLLLAVVMAFSFQASSLMNDLAAEAAGIQAGFHGWGTPFVLFRQAVCEGNLVSLLALGAITLGPLLLAVWLLAGRYKAIVTGLSSRVTHRGGSLRLDRCASPRRALLGKEAARLLGSPMYFFNAGLGLLFLVLGGGLALVKRQLLSEALGQLGGLSALPLAAAVVCFCLASVTISASAVSLEGKGLWILKSAPVPVGDILLAKTGLQLLLALPCVVLGGVGLGLGLGLSPGELVLLLLLGVAFSLFSAPFGLLVNLYFPKLDAPNDMVVVKQSVALLVTLFGSMLLVGLGAGAVVVLRPALGELGVLLLCLVVCSAAAAAAWRLLLKRGPALFAAL